MVVGDAGDLKPPLEKENLVSQAKSYPHNIHGRRTAAQEKDIRFGQSLTTALPRPRVPLDL